MLPPGNPDTVQGNLFPLIKTTKNPPDVVITPRPTSTTVSSSLTSIQLLAMDDETKQSDYLLDLTAAKPSSTRDQPLEWLSIDDDVCKGELTNIDLERGRGGATPIIVSRWPHKRSV